MWNPISILTLATAIVSLASTVACKSESWVRLQDLCDGKEDADLVVWPDQIRQVAKPFDEPNPPVCSEHIETAVKELRYLYEFEASNVCTLQKVSLLNDFVHKYLAPPSNRLTANDKKLPETLETYTIAYGMLLSSRCTQNMADIFNSTLARSLQPTDFEELEPYTGKNSPIARLLDTISKPNEIVLPSDLVAALPDAKMFEKLNIVRQEDKAKAQRVREVCEKRFKPIYEPAVAPVAALFRAGFKYISTFVESNLRRSKKDIQIQNWSRIVFLCDSLRFVDVTNGATGTGTDLSLEQMPTYEPTEDVSINVRRLKLELKPTLFKEHVAAIEKFYESHTSDIQRLQNNLVKKSWSLVKSRLKYGEYKKLVKSVFSKLKLNRKSKGQNNDKDRQKLSPDERELEFVNKEISDILSSDDKDVTLEYKVSGAVGRSVKTGAIYTATAIMTVPLFIYCAIMSIADENPDLRVVVVPSK